MKYQPKKNSIKNLSGEKYWVEIKKELGLSGDFWDYCHNCYRPVDECICDKLDRKIYDYLDDEFSKEDY